MNGVFRDRLKVILPDRSDQPHYHKLQGRDIAQIICHRRLSSGTEEYLVKWKRDWQYQPYSWHPIEEFKRNSLGYLQEYIESIKETPSAKQNLKRKVAEAELDDDGYESANSSIYARFGLESHEPVNDGHANRASYNCIVERRDGRIEICEPSPKDRQIYNLPTLAQKVRARSTPSLKAEIRIAKAFDDKIGQIKGPPITVVNRFDGSRPPLNFHFIEESIPRSGVEKADRSLQIGCGSASTRQPGNISCRPHMGQHIGCEYSRVCECMEFAAVDKKRFTEEERFAYENNLPYELARLPKRFPYFAPNKGTRSGCLTPFYLSSRYVIYECNDACACGPDCKTRVVQHGRKVPLEIFKTEDGRGWGLRCMVDLQEGQFIDTYRGELITNEEATKREQSRGKAKDCYLYDLDKHVDDETRLTREDVYTMDGEFYGGVSRFMNHSCQPNCAQFTVSLNKYDIKVYELAFFARRLIPKGEELTFDYKDQDDKEDGDSEAVQEGELKCKCGSASCRGFVW